MQKLNKKLMEAIKDYILEDENREEVVAELKRYKKEFGREPDYNWYRYGNILPYYSQIRDFYNKLNVPCSDDNEIMCNDFCYHVGKAIDNILEAENE
jgi:hypothetical protein